MKLRERSPSLWKQRGYIGIGNRRAVGGRGTWQQRIDELIENADFRSELLYTAIPQRAAPGTTATFTRATTSTWPNNDGYMVTGLAGEIGFPGARRVYNLLPSSENLTVGFTATGSTLAAGSITESGATSGHYAQTTSMVIPATAIFIMQAEIKQSVGTRNIGIGTNSVGNAIFNPSTGVFVANDGATLDHGTGTQTADGYWPVWVKVQATTSNKPIISLYSGTTQSYAGDGASQVLVRKFQVEDVTAQTTQTAGEYVSVGVESAPYYHGSFVDGVKCFPTDLSGNPIPSATLLGYQAEGARTNLCLQSNAFTTTWLTTGTPTPTQNAVGPDGATSAWTLTDADGVDASVYQGLTLTAAAWTASVFVKKTTGAQTSYPVLVFYPSDGTQVQAATVDTTNGVVTDWTSFTASTMAAGRSVRISSFNDDYWRVELTKTGTAATHYFQLLPAGTTAPTYAGPTISTAATGSAVFYGAQVELGSFASSYIPTTTAAVTRNADALTYSSAGNIDGTKGWCYAEVAANWSASPTDPKAIAAFQSSIDYGLWYLTSANNLTLTDGAAAAGAEKSFTILPTAQKVAATWSSAANRSLGAAQGVVGSADTFGTAFTPDQIGVGIYRNGTVNGEVHWFGNIKNVRIGQRQLSSSELGAITS